MTAQLLIGAAVTIASLVVTASFIAAAVQVLTRFSDWLAPPVSTWRVGLVISLSSLWLLLSLLVSIWIWAVVYRAVGAFDAFEPAFYFAIISFTTLGFGDVILEEPWRLTAGICAANGLLIFGLCTAFLVEEFRMLLRRQA